MPGVLLIDRKPVTLRRLHAVLGAHCAVVPVCSVFTAFRLLRRKRFAAIVVRSSDHDAYAIAVQRWLAARCVSLPVIAVFGTGSAGDAGLARRLGARAIFSWRPSDYALLRVVMRCLMTDQRGNGVRRTLGEPVPGKQKIHVSRPIDMELAIHMTVCGPSPPFRDHHEAPWFSRERSRSEPG